MGRPTAKQELEAVAAFLVNAIVDKVEIERQLRLQEHRIIMLDAERHRLFDQLAEEERKEVEPLMDEATEKGLGQARWLQYAKLEPRRSGERGEGGGEAEGEKEGKPEPVHFPLSDLEYRGSARRRRGERGGEE